MTSTKRLIVDPDPAADTATDWAALDAMTDEDIRRQIAENPDAAPELTPEVLASGRFRRLERAMTASAFRAWREAAALTQDQAAATLGLTLARVQQYEAGRPIPRAVALACAALALDRRLAAAETEGRAIEPKELREEIAPYLPPREP
jgi:putative transcriptional regulator